MYWRSVYLFLPDHSFRLETFLTNPASLMGMSISTRILYETPFLAIFIITDNA